MVKLLPEQGIKVREKLTYLYDPDWVPEVENIVKEATALSDQIKITAEDAKTVITDTKTTAVEEVTEIKNSAIKTVEETSESAKQDINTTVDEASMRLSDTIEQAVEDVKNEAVAAAEGAIQDAAATATAIVVDYANNEIKPELIGYRDSADEDAKDAEKWAKTSKIWATGEDAEVNEIAPNEEEHSSRGYADLAMAIANTPEDTPVDASKLLALDVIRGPKGDSGEAEFGGDIHFTGSFNVEGDDNHPIKITAMAGTSASGYQVVDSGGLGDSDFEHYATGDRYGTRITNHNNTSDTSVSIDLYQSNAGRSVLDLSDVETILAPALLGAVYPVGSIYITTNETCPIADLGVGTWELVARDRVLQGAGDRGDVGTTLEAGLPNITGRFDAVPYSKASDWKGAFYSDGSSKNTPSGGDSSKPNVCFSASRSSSIYGNSDTVQPAAYLVNIFRRIS